MGAKLQAAITQMNSGKIAPVMEGRTDVQVYPYSCRKTKNAIPLVYGSNRNRGGSAFVSAVKNSANKTALIPFKVGENVAYQIEIGDEYLRFYKDRELITLPYYAWVNGSDTVYTKSAEPTVGDNIFTITDNEPTQYEYTVASVEDNTFTDSNSGDWIEATLNNNLGNHKWYAGMAWDGTKFVAIGYTGYISTSIDGVVWSEATQVANLGDNSWATVTWDGTKFVALSALGYLSTSTDGTTWSAATQVANFSNYSWTSIAWSGTKFVALATLGYISTSTDGTTWS
ncbi:MAG: hypothetical protein J5601_02795, partial [Elusimicrobiaceae bacterium]|nr:hypothetical protein [Elusimicrobiaceae bacterium]